MHNNIFIDKNLTLTLTLTTQENWREYCVLKFQGLNQFMYDLPWELMCIQLSKAAFRHGDSDSETWVLYDNKLLSVK